MKKSAQICFDPATENHFVRVVNRLTTEQTTDNKPKNTTE